MLFPFLACATAALGLLLLAGAGPAYRTGLLPLAGAFTLLRWAGYAGLAASALGVLAAGLAYVRAARLRMLAALVGLLGGIAAFGIPFEFERRQASAPPIHDISTDLENPPAFDAVVPLRTGAPNGLERPPAVADEQRKGYPDIAPVTLPEPQDQVFNRALAAAQDAGWRIVTADLGRGRIEATDTSRWFGFTDDIVVRLLPWGSGTRVDMRSVSRLGRTDGGANARRIRRFLARLRSS
ncbi:MAG: DUF1499 domain-containing protein [Acidobacteria bacterium]|nr:DUF1499 domain-containing protein [Acidobacteriota bacterium]